MACVFFALKLSCNCSSYLTADSAKPAPWSLDTSFEIAQKAGKRSAAASEERVYVVGEQRRIGLGVSVHVDICKEPANRGSGKIGMEG